MTHPVPDDPLLASLTPSVASYNTPPPTTDHLATLPLALPDHDRESHLARLRAEQADLWRAGERLLVEDLVSRHPWLQKDAHAILELLQQEIRLREESGETPELDEYVRRFPSYRANLEGHWQSPPGQTRSGPGTDAKASWQGPETGASLPDAIGKYRVIERLGSGGQGEVFRAVHPTLGRDVVVKWANQSISEKSRQRLLDEGRVLASLRGPGLVQVYDVDFHAGRPFVVFEHVAGQTLTSRLARDRPSPQEAARFVAEAAAALELVHRQGVLHRDIKPANMLIDATGHIRLIDFGLASLAHPYGEINAPGPAIVGTLSYMAPEQAHGRTELLGPRTDVFSLGCVLYELLTGQPPYWKGDRLEILSQAGAGNVTRPRQVDPHVPVALEQICMKALAPDTDQRYASAGAFERALRRYLRRRQRRIVAATLASALAVAALATAVTIPFLPQRLGTQPEPPRTSGAPEALVPLTGELIARVWSPDSGKRGLRIGEDAAALPVRTGEQVHVEARLNQPAYVYLLWLDANGMPVPLYPWHENEIVSDLTTPPPPHPPRQRVHSPTEETKGWSVSGSGGLETLLLLARRTPWPPEQSLAQLIGKLPPAPFQDPRELLLRGFDGEQAVTPRDEHRGPSSQSTAIDDPLVQLLGKLRPHFETIRAVRFAHQEK